MSDDEKRWYELSDIIDESGNHKALWWEVHDNDVGGDMYSFNKSKNTSSNIVCLNRYGFILQGNGSTIKIQIPRDMEGEVAGSNITNAQEKCRKIIPFANDKIVHGFETSNSEKYLAILFESGKNSDVEVFSPGNLILGGSTKPLYKHSFGNDSIVDMKFIKDQCILGLTLSKNVYLLCKNEKTKINESNICSIAVSTGGNNTGFDGVFGKADGGLTFFSVGNDGKTLKIVSSATKPPKINIEEDGIEILFFNAHFVHFLGSNYVLVVHKAKLIFDGDEDDFEYKYQYHIYEISSNTWTLILNNDNQEPLNIEIENGEDQTNENVECIFFVKFISAPWNVAIISADQANNIALIGLNPNTKCWEHWKPAREEESDFDNIQLKDLNGEKQFVCGMGLSLNFQADYKALSSEELPDKRIPPCPNIIINTIYGSIIRLILADEYLLTKPHEKFMILQPKELEKENAVPSFESNPPAISFSANATAANSNSKNVAATVPSLSFGSFGASNSNTPANSITKNNASKATASFVGLGDVTASTLQSKKQNSMPVSSFGGFDSNINTSTSSVSSKKTFTPVSSFDGFAGKAQKTAETNDTKASFGGFGEKKANNFSKSNTKVESKKEGHMFSKNTPTTSKQTSLFGNVGGFNSNKPVTTAKAPASMFTTGANSTIKSNSPISFNATSNNSSSNSNKSHASNSFGFSSTPTPVKTNNTSTPFQMNSNTVNSSRINNKNNIDQFKSKTATHQINTAPTHKTTSQRSMLSKPRRPAREISKYERVVQESFIRYFEGGDASNVLNLDDDQIADQELILDNIKEGKKDLNALDLKISTINNTMDKMSTNIIKIRNDLQTIQAKSGQIKTTYLLLAQNKDNVDSNPLPSPILSRHEKLRANIHLIENKIRELVGSVNLKRDALETKRNSANTSKNEEIDIASRRRLLRLVQQNLSHGVKILNTRITNLNEKHLKLKEVEDKLYGTKNGDGSLDDITRGNVSFSNSKTINYISGEENNPHLIDGDLSYNEQANIMETFEDMLVSHCEQLNGYESYINGELNDQDLEPLYRVGSTGNLSRGENQRAMLEEQRYEEKQSEYMMSLQSNPLHNSQTLTTPIRINNNNTSITDSRNNDESMMSIVEPSSMGSTFRPSTSTLIGNTSVNLGETADSKSEGINDSTKKRSVSFGFLSKPSANSNSSMSKNNSSSMKSTNNNQNGSTMFGGNGIDFGKSVGLGVIKEESNEDTSFGALGGLKTRNRDGGLKVDDLSDGTLFGGGASKGKRSNMAFGGTDFSIKKPSNTKEESKNTDKFSGIGGKKSENEGGFNLGGDSTSKKTDTITAEKPKGISFGGMFGEKKSAESDVATKASPKKLDVSGNGSGFAFGGNAPKLATADGGGLFKTLAAPSKDKPTAPTTTTTNNGGGLFGNNNSTTTSKPAGTAPPAGGLVSFGNKTASAPGNTTTAGTKTGGNLFGNTTLAQPTPGSGGGTQARDYKAEVTMIYQKYNPTKINSIDGLLVKYRGHEAQLIERLKKKYNTEPGVVNNSKQQGNSAGFGSGNGFGQQPQVQNNAFGSNNATPAVGGFGSSTSGFGGAATGFGQSNNSGFGAVSSNGFGQQPQQQNNAFGNNNTKPAVGGFGTNTSGFGAAATNVAGNGGFGSVQPTTSNNGFSSGGGFGSNNNAVNTAGFGGNGFGQGSNSNAFGAGGGFGSNNNNASIRNQVIQIYQQYNPSKLSQVDANLNKYRGREQVLLQKLKKKYMSGNNNAFGSTNTGGFGQQTNNNNNTNAFGGGGGGFGSTTTNGGQNTGFGASNTGGFGSTNTGGFGSTNTGGFGSTNTGGFGSTNTGGFGQQTNNNNNTNAFGGGGGGFGSTTTNGGQNTGFGASNTGGFGQQTNTNNNANAFGGGGGGFGSTTTNGGQNTGGFGSSNTGGFGTTNTGGFGQQTNNNNNTNAFGGGGGGFGSTTTNGGQNTGFGASNTGGFGSTNTGGFGSTNTGGFGSTNTGGFGNASTGFGASNTGGFGSFR